MSLYKDILECVAAEKNTKNIIYHTVDTAYISQFFSIYSDNNLFTSNYPVAKTS